jgi:hypothetical protein
MKGNITMTTLNKRVQVLVTEDMWHDLTVLAQERESSVGHLIREAVAQMYFVDDVTSDLNRRLQIVASMASYTMPVDDWETMEAEVSDRTYFDEVGEATE